MYMLKQQLLQVSTIQAFSIVTTILMFMCQQKALKSIKKLIIENF